MFNITIAAAAQNLYSRDVEPEERRERMTPVTRRKFIGVESSSFREFGQDAAIAMTGEVGIRRICLKDVDLKDPLPGLAESVGYVRGLLAVL